MINDPRHKHNVRNKDKLHSGKIASDRIMNAFKEEVGEKDL
jgi:hypothetical protein